MRRLGFALPWLAAASPALAQDGPALPAVPCADMASLQTAAAAAVSKPQALDGALFRQALQALADHGCAAAGKATPRQIVIVDYGLHSRQPRAFIVDLRSGAGLERGYLMAHGRGSDADHDGYADRFRDVAESKSSILGSFRGDFTYDGENGHSVKLHGLDPGNRNAWARKIVLHAQSYVSPAFVKAHGRLGRSWGCFVVSKQDLPRFSQTVRNGGFLFAGLSDSSHVKP